MKWFWFTAYYNGEEVMERIPADTMEDAALELGKLGYKNVSFIKMIENGIITNFEIGEVYTESY